MTTPIPAEVASVTGSRRLDAVLGWVDEPVRDLPSARRDYPERHRRALAVLAAELARPAPARHLALVAEMQRRTVAARR